MNVVSYNTLEKRKLGKNGEEMSTQKAKKTKFWKEVFRFLRFFRFSKNASW